MSGGVLFTTNQEVGQDFLGLWPEGGGQDKFSLFRRGAELFCITVIHT